MRYRIVQVPIQGKPDKYRVEVYATTTEYGLFTERKIEGWRRLDICNGVWEDRGRGPSMPQQKLFKSQDKAKEYIKQRLEYLSKEDMVVFDTLTANPPKETGT